MYSKAVGLIAKGCHVEIFSILLLSIIKSLLFFLSVCVIIRQFD